ncbi:MAG: NAD-dependent epimerase/dehydratase family protein [Bacteroidota bacterium]
MRNGLVLLTGATGFIGHHLAAALAAGGHDVRYLVRSAERTGILPKHRPDQVVVGDLLDVFSLESALTGCTAVIHAAAKVSFHTKDRPEMWAVNQGGTANIINAALGQGVKQFVYLSSVAALNRESGKVTTLSDSWQEQLAPTVYGQTKFAAEREVWRGQAEGMNVSIIYPSTVIGSGDWRRPGTPRLFHRAKQGMLLAPSGRAGFVAVEDVVSATQFALERAEDGLRLLLNAEELNWSEALAQIAKSVAAPPPKMVIPSWASAALWPFSTFAASLRKQPPSISRDLHRTATADYAYDGSSYLEHTGRNYAPIAATITATGKAYLDDLKKVH